MMLLSPALRQLPAAQGTPAPASAPQAPTTPATPEQIYRALVEQRSELLNQMSALEDKRGELTRELARQSLPTAAQAGLVERIGEIDKQIAVMDKAIAAARAEVAKAAAVPGAIVVRPPQPRPPQPHPNDADYALITVFGLVLLLPASIAFARRIWRRSAAAVSNWPKGLNERIDRLEQTVDAVAIEVERVGEGQRYMTSLFAQNGAPQALGAGSMEPIEMRERERVEQQGRRT